MAPAASATTSTRWCPTPEQLMILEEMYRGGVRTPNATQIQHITAHLSLYGKIEGKNVFYWFQNHKARDRQKLRRRLAKQLLLAQQQQHQHHTHNHNHLMCCPPFFHNPASVNINANACLSPPPLSALDYYNSSLPCFMPPHPQGDVMYEQAMGCQFKIEMMKDQEPAMRAHNGDDWVVISPTFNSRPVETLELFPITSSSDCNLV